MPVNNKRVVLIGPSAEKQKGGIAHFTSSLAQALDKECQLLFISWSRLYPPFLTKRNFTDTQSKQKCFDLTAKFLLSYVNPLSWLRTVKAIATFKADKVLLSWVHPIHAPIYLVLIPLIRVFNKSDIILLCHNVEPHELFWGARLISKLVFQHVDSIVVHSTSEETKLKQVQSNLKIIKLFHPIYDFLPLSNQMTSTKGEGCRLLFFGLIRPYKGLDLLLGALEQLIKEKHKVKLTIAGECFSEEANNLLVQEVSQRGLDEHVRLELRYIPNERVADYFLDCDLVILPYRSATSSGPLMMALHFGKPVIATNVGGIPDYIVDGKNGVLCEPDINSIADGIIQGISNVWSASEIKECAKLFTWPRYVSAILNPNVNFTD